MDFLDLNHATYNKQEMEIRNSCLKKTTKPLDLLKTHEKKSILLIPNSD